MAQGSSTMVSANDFVRQWQDIHEDALDAVDRVGSSGWLILGEEVSLFEREFAAWWSVPHAVGVASGLDALEIALRCAGVATAQRVLTTPLSAFATTIAILRIGAEPVWCDVDETGGLDLDRADAALRADRSIRAVLPVHLYGHPIDPDGLEALAATYDVVVVEDCAQSAGAERLGRPTAMAGVAAGTSLYPTKNLGAMGDGGVLLTRDEAVASRARRLRDYGQAGRYEHVEVGLNSRLDELHAAILRTALLPRLGRWIDRRREIAGRYTDALKDCSLRPVAVSGGLSANHLFAVESLEQPVDAVIEALRQQGVIAGRHYPFVAPDQPAISGRGHESGSLAIARRLSERELSLPIHPYLEDTEIGHVIDVCLSICA